MQRTVKIGGEVIGVFPNIYVRCCGWVTDGVVRGGCRPNMAHCERSTFGLVPTASPLVRVGCHAAGSFDSHQTICSRPQLGGSVAGGPRVVGPALAGWREPCRRDILHKLSLLRPQERACEGVVGHCKCCGCVGDDDNNEAEERRSGPHDTIQAGCVHGPHRRGSGVTTSSSRVVDRQST